MPGTHAPIPSPRVQEGSQGQGWERLVLPAHEPSSPGLQEAQSDLKQTGFVSSSCRHHCLYLQQKIQDVTDEWKNAGCPAACRAPQTGEHFSWKSEGLQTGLGKHTVSALAFSFSFWPHLASATLPCVPHGYLHAFPQTGLPTAPCASPWGMLPASFCQRHPFEKLEGHQPAAWLQRPAASTGSGWARSQQPRAALQCWAGAEPPHPCSSSNCTHQTACCFTVPTSTHKMPGFPNNCQIIQTYLKHWFQKTSM